jgi:UDP-glucose 4-epimerase
LGGLGFIGRNLAETLCENNDVIVLDKNNDDSIKSSKCRYFNCDISDTKSLQHLLDGVDVLYHLISTTNPTTSAQNITYDIDTNVLGTVNLLQAAVNQGAKKIIFASSGGTVYGEPLYNPIDEKHPTNPVSSYGAGKLAVEKYIQVFHKTHGLDYCILRFSNVYGRYQTSNTQGIINIFLRRILNHEPIEIWGDGTATRDYIYVSDAVEALSKVAMKSHTNKLFNVGSNEGITVNEIIKTIEDITGIYANTIYKEKRSIDVHSNVLDCSLISEVYKFNPKVTLHQGIERILET